MSTGPSATALERLNMNVPADARAKLRALAKAAGKPEAVYARDLLVSAVEDAERADFLRRLKASRTPEVIAREREIVAAMQRMREGDDAPAR